MKLQKKNIQDTFLSLMGLRVDYRQPGFGCSNDGNTARRFFQNSQFHLKLPKKGSMPIWTALRHFCNSAKCIVRVNDEGHTCFAAAGPNSKRSNRGQRPAKHRLMLQSDSFISLRNMKTRKNKKKIPTAALALLSDTAIEKQTDCEVDSENE